MNGKPWRVSYVARWDSHELADFRRPRAYRTRPSMVHQIKENGRENGKVHR